MRVHPESGETGPSDLTNRFFPPIYYRQSLTSQQTSPSVNPFISTATISAWDPGSQIDWSTSRCSSDRRASQTSIATSAGNVSNASNNTTPDTSRETSPSSASTALAELPIDEQEFNRRCAEHVPDLHTVSERRRRQEAGLIIEMAEEAIEQQIRKLCREDDVGGTVGSRCKNDRKTVSRNGVTFAICCQINKDRKVRALYSKIRNDPEVLRVLQERGHLGELYGLESEDSMRRVIQETQEGFESRKLGDAEIKQAAKDGYATELRATMIQEKYNLTKAEQRKIMAPKHNGKKANAKRKQQPNP